VLGPEEIEWRETLERDAPGALFPALDGDAVPADLKFSPMLTIALAESLAAGVSNDSGTSHMFAAADLPLVALFGPTSAEKFAPMTTRSAVVTAQEFGSDEMSAIPVDAVMEAVENLIRD
jgi:ADP-heptose:LPS heptosyltransferase